MYHVRSVAVAAAALAICSVPSVFAADMPVKAPFVAAAYNWSGCYIGGYVGAATGRNWTSTDRGSVGQGGTFPLYNGVGTNPWSYGMGSSFIGGGTLGCNWQAPSSNLVLGVEGELGYMKLTGGAIEPNSLDVDGRSKIGDWYGVVAGRLGWAADRVLFYGKVGVAFYKTSSTVIDVGNTVPGFTDTVSASGSKNQVTWAAGAGIEYALGPNWTVKGEYLYLAKGSSYLACGVDANVAQNFCWEQQPGGIHTGKIGLNFKLGR